MHSSPSQQAQHNAVHLSDFLKADGIRQWVEPAVIWADQGSSLVLENPAIAIWTLGRLPDELGNIWRGSAISEADRERIIGKLTLLCQRSTAAQAS